MITTPNYGDYMARLPKVVGVREIRAKMSAYLRAVSRGESITIADRRKKPVARPGPGRSQPRAGSAAATRCPRRDHTRGRQARTQASDQAAAQGTSRLRHGDRRPAVILYLDASAVVKVYVAEAASDVVRELIAASDSSSWRPSRVRARHALRVQYFRFKARPSGRKPQIDGP